jgi:hypothetical protein
MRTFFTVLALVVCVASGAQAQSRPQSPTRPSPGLFGGGRPVDPNQSRNELTLNANLLVGYGDILTPSGAGQGPTDPAQVRTGSTSGTADATLRHYYGKTSRNLVSQFRAYTIAYAEAVSPAVGGSLNVTGSFDVGRKNTLRLSQSAGYEPSLVLGAFTPLQGDVDAAQPAPESAGTSGILQQRSSSSLSSVTLDRRWTTRQSTGVTLSYARISYLDQAGFDSNTLSAHARYNKQLSRTLTLQSSYRYSDSTMGQSTGGEVPLTDNTVDGGFAYSRRISPTRTLEITGGAGASHIETLGFVGQLPLEYWMPSGYGSFRLDVGRSWAMTADYRRAVNVLQGVSLETFPTDAFRLDADGRFGQRVDAIVSAGVANGRAGGGQATGDFKSYTGSAQLRIAVARCCATAVNYSFYHYQLRGVVGLPAGLPSEYDRHSISVGLALYVPLYGSFQNNGRR